MQTKPKTATFFSQGVFLVGTIIGLVAETFTNYIECVYTQVVIYITTIITDHKNIESYKLTLYEYFS